MMSSKVTAIIRNADFLLCMADSFGAIGMKDNAHYIIFPGNRQQIVQSFPVLCRNSECCLSVGVMIECNYSVPRRFCQ